jgi:hypothetical protein
MKEITGVYATQLKNGTPSFRAGITVNGKHISLGSYSNPDDAGKAYTEAGELMACTAGIDDYSDSMTLSFRKYVSLINLRDNHIYFKSPIYLFKKHFMYYVDRDTILTFDVDDLFYYSTKSIMKRGNHLFVADYGMQVNILSRYGIREHSALGRDYYFVNNDRHDFRYGNIVIVNKYYGVRKVIHNNKEQFKAVIHINGDFVIGTYNTEDEAAIAYNKAAHILQEKGIKKSFPENYPESLSAIAYASIYNSVKISARIRNYVVD